MIMKIVLFAIAAIIADLFLLSIIPLTYLSVVPFVVAPVFIFRTLHKAQMRNEKSAQKIVKWFGIGGLVTGLTFSALIFANLKAFPEIKAMCERTDTSYLLGFVEASFFPSSVFYTHHAVAIHKPIYASTPIFFAAVAVNILLYMAYGCVFYYYTRPSVKNEMPA